MVEVGVVEAQGMRFCEGQRTVQVRERGDRYRGAGVLYASRDSVPEEREAGMV